MTVDSAFFVAPHGEFSEECSKTGGSGTPREKLFTKTKSRSKCFGPCHAATAPVTTSPKSADSILVSFKITGSTFEVGNLFQPDIGLATINNPKLLPFAAEARGIALTFTKTATMNVSTTAQDIGAAPPFLTSVDHVLKTSQRRHSMIVCGDDLGHIAKDTRFAYQKLNAARLSHRVCDAKGLLRERHWQTCGGSDV